MKKEKSGFTLLELLVVVGILAALVALALPFYQDYVNQSKITAAEADLQTFKKALAMYDQLESKMFTETPAEKGLQTLIGRYLQDFRTSTTQKLPVDPWGGDYEFDVGAGSIWSAGPNRREETRAAGDLRVAAGDDILVTWKPPFIVSSAQAINAATVEISFSRKVVNLPDPAANYVTMTPAATGYMQKISDSMYRFKLTAALTGGASYTVTVGGVTAQDGATFDSKPEGGPDDTVAFTY